MARTASGTVVALVAVMVAAVLGCSARRGGAATDTPTPSDSTAEAVRGASATTSASTSDGGEGAGGELPPTAEGPPTDRPYAVELASGLFHSCVRLSDGTVRCWGMGESGQLGDGARVNRPVPVTAEGLDGVAQIAAEGNRTCAVRDDGSVWCWGEAMTVDVVAAELADAGSADDLRRTRPERVAVWEAVESLALGNGLDCALATGGRVLCRGTNTRGGVGDGTTEARVEPVTVPVPPAVEVEAGLDFACVRTEDGRVLCWGWNDYCGQFGNGTKQDSLVPVEVPSLAGAIGLSLGGTHACAVLADGTLRCWGCNHAGQIGDGTTEERPVPVAIAVPGRVRSLETSGDQTCVVLENGEVRCWGGDTPSVAQLWTACPTPVSRRMEGPRGDGGWVVGPVETYCTSPAPIAGLTGALQAASGSLHACALLRDGTVRCWGSNFYGAIGDGKGGDLGQDRELPTPVAL